jgi:hypothetical protein
MATMGVHVVVYTVHVVIDLGLKNVLIPLASMD